jgi:site-specific recombinase XerD
MVHPEKAASISSLLDRFCYFLHEQGKKAGTIANYRYDLQALFRDQDVPEQSFHGMCMAAADRAPTYRQKLIQAYSPATLNRKTASLNAFFRFAAHSGWIRRKEIPKFPQVAHKPLKHKYIRFLSESEQNCLLKRASRNREATVYALMSLMLATGARTSEIRSLTWRNVCLEEDRGSITVPNSKSGRASTFPLSAPAFDALRLLRSTVESNEDAFIFQGQSSQLTRQQIATFLERCFAASGLHDAKAVVLRATFEANALADGIDPYELAYLMGYSRLSVPQERYRRYLTQWQRDVHRNEFTLKPGQIQKGSGTSRIEADRNRLPPTVGKVKAGAEDK